MLKKILIPLMLLLLIAPTPQVQAIKGGYFDNTPIPDHLGNYTKNVTDNNNVTAYHLRDGRLIFDWGKKDQVLRIYNRNKWVLTKFYLDGKEVKDGVFWGEGWVDLESYQIQADSLVLYNTIDSGVYLTEYDVQLLSQLNIDVPSADTTANTTSILIHDIQHTGDYVDIYLDDKLIGTIPKNTKQYRLINLKPVTKYKITLKSRNDLGSISNGYSVNISTLNPPKLQQEHVRAQNITDKSAELYVAALIPNYDHIYIYDGSDQLIHQQPIAGMVAYRHQLKDLQQDKSYKYFVQVKHGSVLSDKIQITFKTKKTEKEVGNLQGRNEGESVVLSWINPDYADFKWVKIYRKKEDEPAPKAKFFGFGMMTASAAAGYNPMFKFDGQNWQDLTVEAATTYEYKVTTLDVNESNETDGKTVKVKTLPPKIGGSELTGGEDKKNPDGTPELDGDGNPIKEDFVIKWSTPTKGKVKVMVGGQEYTTVQASQQQVTIPYNQMKYDGLGNPQVQLIPIADNGTTGQTAQPPPPSGGTIGNVVGSGASAAVNANNLLQISLGLLAKVALFILLGMAFMLVPKLIRIIYYAVTGKDSYGMENNEENKKVRVIEKRR